MKKAKFTNSRILYTIKKYLLSKGFNNKDIATINSFPSRDELVNEL